MKLSFVILNYKTRGLLKQCLRGIIGCQLPFAYEIIVVDNNSRDGSLEMVRQSFPGVRLIASPRNVGFSAGNNLGLAAAQGEYVMVVNTDVAIFREAVDALVQYLEEHAEASLAVPKLVNPDGSTQLSVFQFPHFWIPLLRRTPLGKLPAAKHVLRRFLMSDWDHQDSRPIGWALGACLLIRATVLKDIGGFDEQFFLYVEDTDFCRRVWQAGGQVHYVHQAEMVHYHKRESAESPGLRGLFAYPTRVHIQSWLKYFRKYRGQPQPPHSL